MELYSLLLLLVGTACIVADDEAPTALELTEANFKDEVKTGPHFVMFFAPWCGHCKRLAPVWEQLAVKYNTQEAPEVRIGRVDCTQQTALCSAQDVTGYPTLKFFKDGFEKEDGVKYRGNRDAAALEKFIAEKLGNEVPEEAGKAPESAEATVNEGLTVLSVASFKTTVGKGDTFVKFYAPWCGHCIKLAPTWDQLAKVFEKDDEVKIAKIDCTEHQSVCQENDVKGYPTLAYFRNGRKIETYKGARALGELKDFVVTQRELAAAGEANEEGKVPTAADDKPAAAPASAVVKADKNNFDEVVKEGLVFVKFFAPWCGHCKRMAPTWEELAQHYKDVDSVTIAHVDCTAGDNENRELCDGQGVNGFPTLLIFKDGKKVEEYNDKRNLDAFKSFVEKHSKEEDEKKEEAVAKDEL